MSLKEIKKSDKSIEENLKENSKLKIDDLFEKYNTSYEGISVVELEDRLDEYGRNVIDTGNNHTVLDRIKEAVINPFNIVLIVIAIITFITDIVIASNEDYATFILIVTAILTSSFISFIQQSKSDKAAKRLQSMISNKITVVRDDVVSDVDAEEIVPGDILKLSSGDMIPGDVRFLDVKDLFIDQASLTRRSNPC